MSRAVTAIVVGRCPASCALVPKRNSTDVYTAGGTRVCLNLIWMDVRTRHLHGWNVCSEQITHNIARSRATKSTIFWLLSTTCTSQSVTPAGPVSEKIFLILIFLDSSSISCLRSVQKSPKSSCVKTNIRTANNLLIMRYPGSPPLNYAFPSPLFVVIESLHILDIPFTTSVRLTVVHLAWGSIHSGSEGPEPSNDIF